MGRPPFLTIRHGSTVTCVHDQTLAGQWIQHLTVHSALPGGSLAERLQAVEVALKLQLATGTSHLQAIEIAPQAFGLQADARAAVKKIRKRRNAALHSIGQITQSQSREVELAPSPVNSLATTEVGGFNKDNDKQHERDHYIERSGSSEGGRPGQVVKLPHPAHENYPGDKSAYVQQGRLGQVEKLPQPARENDPGDKSVYVQQGRPGQVEKLPPENVGPQSVDPMHRSEDGGRPGQVFKLPPAAADILKVKVISRHADHELGARPGQVGKLPNELGQNIATDNDDSMLDSTHQDRIQLPDTARSCSPTRVATSDSQAHRLDRAPRLEKEQRQARASHADRSQLPDPAKSCSSTRVATSDSQAHRLDHAPRPEKEQRDRKDSVDKHRQRQETRRSPERETQHRRRQETRRSPEGVGQHFDHAEQWIEKISSPFVENLIDGDGFDDHEELFSVCTACGKRQGIWSPRFCGWCTAAFSGKGRGGAHPVTLSP